MTLIVDAHEDLAWNMLSFERDYSLSAVETRRREKDTSIPAWNGDTLLGWPEYQRGQVCTVFGTLFATPAHRARESWDRLVYSTPDEAHRLYWEQVETYHRMVDAHPDQFRLIHKSGDLEAVLSAWQKPGKEDQVPQARPPVGVVILMEGAEGVCSTDELADWWDAGVRIIGPAWAGTRFCGGTHEPGGMTKEGFALLEDMADLNFTLDISHMDEKAALQALDTYPGRIIASHANAAALLKEAAGNRHLSDRVIEGIIERNGVIGVVLLSIFLSSERPPKERRREVSIRNVVDHIDHICQLAGDARHVGVGTDFDGGLGWQDVPGEIDTIADVQKLEPLLTTAGYSSTDVESIMGGNWLSFLGSSLA